MNTTEKGDRMKTRTVWAVLLTMAVAVVMLGACGKASNDVQVEAVSEETTADDGVMDDVVAESPVSDEAVPEDPALQVAGKTWGVLGDSLTEKNFRARTSYYDYVAEDLGCTVVNWGVSGTGYKEAGGAEPFYERVGKMDLTNVDCLTVFGSFNDLGKGYELGTAYDEGTDTIGGCMALTVQRLLEAKPGLSMGIVTPTPWPEGLAYDGRGYIDSHATTREECDAYVQLLKDVAARFDLPVLDLYEISGFNPDDEAQQQQYYTEDGVLDDAYVHPNSEGHRFMYPLWREFVIELVAG